ncbi:DnaJ C-terminal domain-containing protein [Shigella sonnei]
MIEQEIPKTLNEDPGGRRQWSTHPPERPGDAGRKRRSKWRLWLVIHIAPHPLFDIVGQDLEIVVPVSPWEAALGTKSPFQH